MHNPCMSIRLPVVVLAGVGLTSGARMPIHSTLLIDRQGRIHWGRHGGAPFDDVTFLQAQLRRMNQRQAATPSTASR